MDSAPALSSANTVSANLRMIRCALLAALGAWRLEPVLALVLYGRIGTTLRRIERMLVRFRAGKLWRVTQREFAQRRLVCRKPTLGMPRRFGWLVQIGGHQAACVGSQLQAVLNTPEMADLLAASAQAGRILRPLCRALAVELPGKISASATERAEMTPRRLMPRAAPERFGIPLPRGVLAAARRAGFGKAR